MDALTEYANRVSISIPVAIQVAFGFRLDDIGDSGIKANFQLTAAWVQHFWEIPQEVRLALAEYATPGAPDENLLFQRLTAQLAVILSKCVEQVPDYMAITEALKRAEMGR